MFRRVVGVGLVAAMQIGAWQSAFLHAHMDDHDTPHHHGRLVHAHTSAHEHHVALAPGVLAIHDDDTEHTLALQLFVAVAATAFDAPALPEHSFTISHPVSAAVRRPPAVSHAHDPPVAVVLASRAPPRSLPV